MSLSMNMDLLGRMSMGGSMSGMDMTKAPVSGMDMPKEPMSGTDMPKEPMSGMDMSIDTSMAHFLPLAGMWAIMMAAMMLPTMVPTLRSYEDLMVSANGTRISLMSVLVCYSIVGVLFSSVISGIQLGLLYLNVVDMMGKVVYSSENSSSKIDVSSFEVGTYIVVSNGVDGKQIGQFIKTK